MKKYTTIIIEVIGNRNGLLATLNEWGEKGFELKFMETKQERFDGGDLTMIKVLYLQKEMEFA